MKENTILYFDLENTLINHWTDQSLCWQENNRSILAYQRPRTIGIFSFALWCDENIKTFIHDGMKEMIENEYSIEINVDEIIHVNRMIEAYNSLNQTPDHPSSNNKEKYFEAWIQVNYNRVVDYDDIVLVDDTVTECSQYIEGITPMVHYTNPVEV